MSMRSREEVDSLRNKLLNTITVAGERGRAGERYNRELETNLGILRNVTAQITNIVLCVKHLDNICANIEHYAVEHQKTAKSILARAIEEAGALVPDAVGDDVHPRYHKDSVVLVNKHGEIIDDVEGGGYRAVLGVCIRYALMKAQPGALPLMIFDEALFAIDDDTTARLKKVLSAMKRDTTILVIEQRRNVVDGITDKQYNYAKGIDEVIRVTEVS